MLDARWRCGACTTTQHRHQARKRRARARVASYCSAPAHVRVSTRLPSRPACATRQCPAQRLLSSRTRRSSRRLTGRRSRASAPGLRDAWRRPLRASAARAPGPRAPRPRRRILAAQLQALEPPPSFCRRRVLVDSLSVVFRECRCCVISRHHRKQLYRYQRRRTTSRSYTYVYVRVRVDPAVAAAVHVLARARAHATVYACTCHIHGQCMRTVARTRTRDARPVDRSGSDAAATERSCVPPWCSCDDHVLPTCCRRAAR